MWNFCRGRQSPGRLFFLLPTKERTKENCRCCDAADPRLRGCTPLRTPKRKSEGAGAKRKQYYFSFLTPPPLPPLLSRVFPRTPAGVNGCSVGAAYMPPATYRSNPFPGSPPSTGRTLPACFAATSPDGEAFPAGFARAKGPLVKGGWPRQRPGGFRRALRHRPSPSRAKNTLFTKSPAPSAHPRPR